MIAHLPIAAVTVILLWWFGTGIVLWLQRRLDPRHPVVVLGLTLVAAAALALVTLLSEITSVAAIYASFAATIVIWGCLELTHHLGLITGTHQQTCPENTEGWQRFRLALGTSIWHEVSVVAMAALLALITSGAANSVAIVTFMVLWLMRWSAKLNLFFGVPNFNAEWLPPRLAHLPSYMRHTSISALFPVSMVLATLALIGLAHNAATSEGSQAIMSILPAVLLCLAMIEHAFLALPVADGKLWNRLFLGDAPDSSASSRTSPRYRT